MAFGTSYNDTYIKNIDVNNIPDDFIRYYRNVSSERREAIRDMRPDLVHKLSPSRKPVSEGKTPQELRNKKIKALWDKQTRYSWGYGEIHTSVLVCTVVPIGTLTCPIDHSEWITKQVKVRLDDSGYTSTIEGRYCKKCKRFYIYENTAKKELDILRKYRVWYLAPSLEETIKEHNKNIKSVEIPTSAIYVPDTWLAYGMTCPIHSEVQLFQAPYFRQYKDRKVQFQACYCSECRKYIMKNSDAQNLQEECAEIGIPQPELIHLRKKKAVNRYLHPEFYLEGGKRFVYRSNPEDSWVELTEEDILVVNDTRECTEEDHYVDLTLCMLTVNVRKKGIQRYLVKTGFCDECDRYYIEKTDYDYIASIGRAKVTIVDETTSNYAITSGTTFDQERDHLKNIVHSIKRGIDDIKHTNSYVGRYAVISGGYDDGQLSFNKQRSEGLYKEIEKLSDYLPKPYGYRRDILVRNSHKTFYLGAADIEIDGEKKVISFNSEFGKKLVNIRNISVDFENLPRKIVLNRDFDIADSVLYGFTERSDEDVYFKNGIRDDFLISVLNSRRKQHQLLDIISTIQKKQDEIVDFPIEKNVIVQGCAGSGKTMVMLHRISQLKYNYPEYNFNQALILTPNDNFSTHISGVAESLQIGHIDRLSVESYYVQLLSLYDASFEVKNKITEEIYVNQHYVDYLYSNEFLQLMKESYFVEEKRITELLNTCSLLVVPGITRHDITDGKLHEKISDATRYVEHVVNSGKSIFQQIRTMQRELDESKLELKRRQEKTQEERQKLKLIITDQFNSAKSKMSIFVKDLESDIEELQKAILSPSASGNIIGNRRKKSRAEKELKNLIEKHAKIDDFFKQDINSMKYEELLVLFNQFNEYDFPIKLDIRIIRDQHFEYVKAVEKEKESESIAEKRGLELQESQLKPIPTEVVLKAKKLYEELLSLTPKEVYNRTFLRAQMTAHEIIQKRYKKTFGINYAGVHRYDLYLQLQFAKRYFGGNIGQNKLIFIDEGQDLTINEYRLICDINNKEVILNVFGDTMQLLKPGRGINDWTLISDVFYSKPEIRELNENYRNTVQITEYCNNAFSMKMQTTGIVGSHVRDISRNQLENELEKVRNKNERIALLLPRKIRKNRYLKEDVLSEDLKKALEDNVIGNGHISVEYVDEIKGIEFDRVFVVPNGMSENEKYIAYTRALSRLIIVDDSSIDISASQSQSNAMQEGDTDTFSKQNGGDGIGGQKRGLIVDSRSGTMASTRKEVNEKRPYKTQTPSEKIDQIYSRGNFDDKKKEKEQPIETKDEVKRTAAIRERTDSHNNKSFVEENVMTTKEKDSQHFVNTPVSGYMGKYKKKKGVQRKKETNESINPFVDFVKVGELTKYISCFTQKEVAYLANNHITSIGEFRECSVEKLSELPSKGKNEMYKKNCIRARENLNEVLPKIQPVLMGTKVH